MDTNDTLEKRRTTHGEYAVTANAYDNMMKVISRANEDRGRLPPELGTALSMIVMKIARIISGDCKHIDHWDDIAGYAILAAKELQE
jgi:hypothetical protein